MQNKEKPFTVVYQAGIAQNTGEVSILPLSVFRSSCSIEDWTDARITLETITPSAGDTEPVLYPWRLTVAEPLRRRRSVTPPRIIRMASPSRRSRSPRRAPQVIYAGDPSPRRRARSPSPQIIRLEDPSHRSSGSVRRRPAYLSRRSRSRTPPPRILVTQGVDFTGQGTISATYLIPGKITIPSDSQTHNVTVVQLELEAELSWVTVPKRDTKVYIKVQCNTQSRPGYAI